MGSWPSSKKSDFMGMKMRYGATSLKEVRESLKREGDKDNDRSPQHATQWHNQRPVCPYGCGEEGQLVEIVMKENKALGIYQDSEGLIFTADLQMSPKPTGRKITIGPDGEPVMEMENSTNG